MTFVERVNQGESLASWLDWLTEPPAVCWSVMMGDLSASWKGVSWTLPEAFRTGPPSCAVHSMWTGDTVVNSLWSCDDLWHQRSWPSFLQEIACCLFGAKALPKLLLTYYQLELQKQILMKFSFKGIHLELSAKCYSFCSGLNVLDI